MTLKCVIGHIHTYIYIHTHTVKQGLEAEKKRHAIILSLNSI